MKKITLVWAAAVLISFSACNNNKTDDSKEVAEEINEQKFDDTQVEDDTKFAVDAADDGLLEVELGKLAQTNGSSKAVKDFGQTMVKEHEKANNELKSLADQKNISLPVALSEEKQKTLNEFAEKKGAEFDKAYSSYAVDNHKDDIEEFEKIAENGKDPDVKTWASAKIPTLQHHLQLAESLKNNIK